MLTHLIHHDPDVYLLKVPFTNISTDATNTYIIKSGNETLVVDTGAPTDEGTKVLQEGLRELQIDLENTKFFITHFHLDHAGLVDVVTSLASPLYVSFAEYSRTRPEGRIAYSEEAYRQFVSMGASDEEASMVRQMKLSDGGFVGEGHNFIFAEEGDTIKVGNYCFDVVDTSGHTPGHLSLFEAEKGLFFGGDHMLFVISPSIDYISHEVDSFEVYIHNLTKLKSLPIQLFLPAHGDIRDDFIERIDWLIDHHESRLTELLNVIEEHPDASGIDLVKYLHWNVPADSWEDISLIQRSIIIVQGLVLLKHLERMGKIEKNERIFDTHLYRKR